MLNFVIFVQLLFKSKLFQIEGNFWQNEFLSFLGSIVKDKVLSKI